MSEDRERARLDREVTWAKLRAVNSQQKMIEREARAAEDKERRERFIGYKSFWEMVWWDREVGALAGVILLTIVFLVWYFWEDILDALPWILLVLVLVGIGVWFLYRKALLYNPFDRLSRIERLHRQREKRIARALGNTPEDELTQQQQELRGLIEGHYNAKIGKILDK